MAIIDPAIVKVLVETKLQTVNASVIPQASLLFNGDPGPDGLAIKVKLMPIVLAPSAARSRSNVAGDEPDLASIVVTVSIEISRSQMAAHPGSMASVQAELGRVLSQGVMRDNPLTHQVDFRRVRHVSDPEDVQRQSSSASTTLEGTVCRPSGSTMTPFVS